MSFILRHYFEPVATRLQTPTITGSSPLTISVFALSAIEIFFTIVKSIAIPTLRKRVAIIAFVVESLAGTATSITFSWIIVNTTMKCGFSASFTYPIVAALLLTEITSVAVEFTQIRSKLREQNAVASSGKIRRHVLQIMVFIFIAAFLIFWVLVLTNGEHLVEPTNFWDLSVDIFFEFLTSGELPYLIPLGILLAKTFLLIIVRILYRKNTLVRVSLIIASTVIDLALTIAVLAVLPSTDDVLAWYCPTEPFFDPISDEIGETCCSYLRKTTSALFSTLLTGYSPTQVVIVGSLVLVSGVTALSAHGMPSYSHAKEVTNDQAVFLETVAIAVGPVAIIFSMASTASSVGAVALAVVLPQILALVAPLLGEYVVALFRAARSREET